MNFCNSCATLREKDLVGKILESVQKLFRLLQVTGSSEMTALTGDSKVILKENTENPHRASQICAHEKLELQDRNDRVKTIKRYLQSKKTPNI